MNGSYMIQVVTLNSQANTQIIIRQLNILIEWQVFNIHPENSDG